MSSTRDRTSEFFSIADRLGGSVGASASGGGGAGAGSGLAPRGLSGSSLGSSSLSGAALSKVDSSLFASKASSIGMGIHATSTKLARLAALAKRTSMFDDPAREIAELTGVIKQDIASLNAAISDLQNLSRGTSGSNKQTAAHGTTVVNNLKTKLMGAMKQFKEVVHVDTLLNERHGHGDFLFDSKYLAYLVVDLRTRTEAGSTKAAAPAHRSPGATL